MHLLHGNGVERVALRVEQLHEVRGEEAGQPPA